MLACVQFVVVHMVLMMLFGLVVTTVTIKVKCLIIATPTLLIIND